jgi:NitT/TauT family transport system ATP-binding protein
VSVQLQGSGVADRESCTSAREGTGRSAAALSAAGLYHAFRGADGAPMLAVNNVSFDIPRGQFVSIIGPSGCGKTTVLNLLAGLERLQKGALSVLGQPPKAGRPEISVAFARDALLPWRDATDNVALSLEMQGVAEDERRRRAVEMLGRVGLREHAHAYRGQLSQGMRQRVALARALVTRPQLLLLDEPFAALDSQTRVLVQEELLRLLEAQESPVTTLMVTHDLAEAIALSDVILLMSRRPGAIRQVYRVDLPRPRDAVALRADHHFNELHEQIWQTLAEEVRGA